MWNVNDIAGKADLNPRSDVGSDGIPGVRTGSREPVLGMSG